MSELVLLLNRNNKFIEEFRDSLSKDSAFKIEDYKDPAIISIHCRAPDLLKKGNLKEDTYFNKNKDQEIWIKISKENKSKYFLDFEPGIAESLYKKTHYTDLFSIQYKQQQVVEYLILYHLDPNTYVTGFEDHVYQVLDLKNFLLKGISIYLLSNNLLSPDEGDVFN